MQTTRDQKSLSVPSVMDCADSYNLESPTRGDKDEKTAAIVKGARQTFLAKGFDAASMDAIALSANVSKRTVYNRFRSKEELFAAAILETCNRLLPLNLEEIEQTLPTNELMRALTNQFLRISLEPEAIALRRIATFEASRTPALGRAYMENGPRLLVKTCIPVMQRISKRENLEIDDYERAIWHLGSLITEPLYTHVLMGIPPQDMETAITNQLNTGLAAFGKLYGLKSTS